MPLGLAKDSMINLTELAYHKESEDHIVVDDDDDDDDVVSDTTEHTILLAVATATTIPRPGIGGSVNTNGSACVLDVFSGSGQGEMKVNEEDCNIEYPPHDQGCLVSMGRRGSSAPTTTYGKFSRVTTDNSAYEHYRDYSSFQNPLISRQEPPFFENGRLWRCLFPWIASSHGKDLTNTPSDGESAPLANPAAKKRTVSTRKADEQPMGKEILGNQPPIRKSQAVVPSIQAGARSGSPRTAPTANTTQATMSSNSAPYSSELLSYEGNDKCIHNNVPTNDSKGGKPNGILKRTTTTSCQNRVNEKSLSKNSPKSCTSKRRSLFPSYETPQKTQRNYHPEFSPMARVLSVKSHKDMGAEEKSCVWWQRKDYEEFRKTGRMITKAMLEGGSEIWLATNQSWLLPNKDRQSTLKHAFSLAEREVAFQKGDVNAKHEYEDARDKWWHKFGHSRRGLEHIASIDEGRQRQANVRIAIHAVVEEQRRQKVFHREDPEKLRMISLQHTSWARDLAMAAGASDADAVRMNFDDESRKSREFYLIQLSRNTTPKASVPAFMKPALTVKVEPSLLDTYTIPQIRFRQAQSNKKHQPSATSVKITSISTRTTACKSMSTRPPTLPVRSPIPISKSPESIPIKGESESRSRSSMAKQAAGFASGEEIGNMSAVLTGMGPISVAGG